MPNPALFTGNIASDSIGEIAWGKTARETNRPFNELLQYFVMERFLYRLSKSPHAQKFVLSGCLGGRSFF